MKKYLIGLAILSVSFYLYRCGSSIGSGNAYSNSYENVDEMVADAKARITEIDKEDLKGMIDEMSYFTLIDVRETAEHNAGYIAGSISIPRGVVEFRIGSEPFWDDEGMYVPLQTDSLVIYCKRGNRAALAADALQKLGYTNIMTLEGGFLSWKEIYPEMVETNIIEGAPVGPVAASSDAGGC